MIRREFLKNLSFLVLNLALSKFLQSCYNSKFTKSNLIPLNPNNHNNIFILGSGITGLCIGALLSKVGYQVTILEANKNYIGGHARTKFINGFKFCYGPQYVWDFNEQDSSIGNIILNFLEIRNQNPFIPLNKDKFERFYIGDDGYWDIPMGLEKFEELMVNEFPHEKDNICNFFFELNLLYKATRDLYIKGLYLEDLKSILHYILISQNFTLKEKLILYKIYDLTLEELFNRHNLSEKCKRILNGHCGIFAENSHQISAGIYAAATGSYHSGATIPVYGFDHLINSFVNVIKTNNGEIYLGKKITKLQKIGNYIKKIECEDGSTFKPDFIISTLSPRLTCHLIDNCDSTLLNYEPSNSLTTCFLIVDYYKILDEIKGKNFWWQTYPEVINFNEPNMLKKPKFLYASSYTLNRTIDGPPAQIDLIIFCPGNFEQSKAAFTSGLENYQKFKEIVGQKIVERIDEIFFSGIKNKIKYLEIITPFDIYKDLGSEKGNVYGRKPDVYNTLKANRFLDSVDNLQIACATVGQPGIATAFQTSKILFERLTNIKLS